MSIAIIGSGISGLICAHYLHRSHKITVFESADYIGGHTNTVDAIVDGSIVPVDTGFIVFNRTNYPRFSAMLEELGVETTPISMSFSVRDDGIDLEYGGRSLGALFAQHRNLTRPWFWRMLREIRQFGELAPAAARGEFRDTTLGEFLEKSRFSEAFARHYLTPLAAAIWSAPTSVIVDFPFRAFVSFFDAHGMLTPWRPPQWRSIVGGSRQYVHRLVRPFRDRIRLAAPVAAIERDATGVTLHLADGSAEWFEEVILATHSDQALELLQNPTPDESEILGALPYQPSEVVLHTDESVLPRRRRAWSSWNYHVDDRETSGPTVTYYMNMLQRLATKQTLCVSLNSTDRIAPDTIISTHRYHHPVYTHDSFRAREQWSRISGCHRTHYCGAYWGYGFHEDGVRSAERVVQQIGARV